MKINVGGGSKRFEGFVNCDYDARSGAEYIFNLEKDVWPFPDNSVDEVMAQHVMEHLGDGFFHAIQELYRVCKPDALIHIRVPHHRHDCLLHDPTHRRPITPYGMSLFSKKVNDDTDAQGGASSRLGYFFGVDFEIIKVDLRLDYSHPNIEFIKTLSPQDLDKFAYDRTNVFVETDITWKAVKNVSS